MSSVLRTFWTSGDTMTTVRKDGKEGVIGSKSDGGLGGVVALVSDPLRLPLLVENWVRAGNDLPEIASEALLTDSEVDRLVGEALDDRMHVVIDPLFDADAYLIGGYRLVDAARAPAAVTRAMPDLLAARAR